MVGKIECVMPNYMQRNINQSKQQWLYAKRYSPLLQIIRCTRLCADSSNIVQTGRKKFAFLLGSNLPPPLWFGENDFQIWNWFGSARFCVFPLVSFLFCFLCGNKTINLCRVLLIYLSPEYPVQKTFSCGLTSWDSAVRFFSWQWCRRFNSK